MLMILYTTGYVDIAASATDATFDIMIVNDGDEDEAEETLELRLVMLLVTIKPSKLSLGLMMVQVVLIVQPLRM